MERAAGILAGVIVGLIIVMVFFKLSNSNKKMKTEYDERQQLVHGKAYKAAFYSFIVYEFLMMLIGVSEIELPVESHILHFGSIILSCTVLACYNIWHGAYWGLNNNRKRYAILFLVAAVINSIPVIAALKSGDILGTALINLAVLVMMLVLSVLLLIKQVAGKEDDEE